MRRFCWRERSEKLNWRLISALDVAEVVRRGDPAVLEPYALHVTFAKLPTPKDPAIRDAWFLVRVLQLAMEYLLFMRTRDGDVLDSLSQELRQVEQERDEMVGSVQKWKGRARSGDKQVDKLHQVLQNIAKLLQIHGASPSAVATIETLLTELVVERRAKQKRKVLDKEEEMEKPMQEARVCGFCGKLFSSTEYLEKHLVRRHTGENIEVETPVKHKMKQNFVDEEDKENKVKNEDLVANEAAMQKMVQQVERALHQHEEKMRSLAEEEAQKVKQMYERLYTETKQAEKMKTKLAEERNTTRMKTELNQEAQQQLDEIYLQKELAENELADLKQQIQFLILKKKMVGTAANPVLPTNLPHTSDDALIAAESEIKDLQQTLETVNAELTSSREELAKVQALHLSALRKKKELADKLALAREASAVVRQENSSQTEQLAMINETVQTDIQSSPLLIESEVSTDARGPNCEDVGTDPLFVSCQDVGIQTIVVVESPPVEAEVQKDIVHDRVSEHASTTSPIVPEPLLQGSPNDEASTIVEEIVSPEPTAQKEEEDISDYIQQLHIQELLDTIVERAQSTASKVASNDLSVSRKYSSISRHKYIRSQFQHDENVVKGRVASCLSQLEQFSRRFGVPAKSAWLSGASLNIVQQALHGHLEVLPTEVLAKMVVCENAVNAIIENEWVPMEKSRQQALERFKTETRTKSEFSQGLVQQAMAAFGTSMKTNQRSGTTNNEEVAAVNDARSLTEELPVETKLDEDASQSSSTDSKDNSVVTPVRRYSAKNQLTVVVGGEATTEGTAFLAATYVEGDISSPNDDFARAASEVEDKMNPTKEQKTVNYLVESLHRVDEASNLKDKSPEPISKSDDASSLQSRHDSLIAASSTPDEPQATMSSSSSIYTKHPEVTEVSTHDVESVRLGTATDDRSSSWEMNSLVRSHCGELFPQEPSSVESQQAVLPQEDNRRTEWQDEEREERSQLHLPRVDSSSNLRTPQTHISVHHALSRTRSDHFEAASSPQPTDSLQSDRLSAISDFAVIESVTGFERTQSAVMSSEMSFDTSIPTLDESESVDALTSAVVTGLVDTIDRRGEAKDHEDSASSLDLVPTTTRNVQHDSVMSFDDSDIEEVVLT